jgi:hypothetical protein
MGISVYDVNTRVKNDATVISIAGKTMNFFPVVATGNEPAPFVTYLYQPRVPDVEQYWLRCDYIRYSIFDTDAARLFALSERFIAILSIGDLVAQTNGIVNTEVRNLSSYMVGSSLAAPIEKEGWYRMNLDFKIKNVDN